SVTHALASASSSPWARAAPGGAMMAPASASVPIPALTAALARLENSVNRHLRSGGAGSRGVAMNMAPSIGQPILRCPLCPTRYRTAATARETKAQGASGPDLADLPACWVEGEAELNDGPELSNK